MTMIMLDIDNNPEDLKDSLPENASKKAASKGGMSN